MHQQKIFPWLHFLSTILHIVKNLFNFHISLTYHDLLAIDIRDNRRSSHINGPKPFAFKREIHVLYIVYNIGI